MPTIYSPSRVHTGQLNILAYHGINPHGADRLTVSPSLFAAQMEWLDQSGAQVVPLAEGVSRLRRGDPSRLVSITFDDGYADFADFAAPILARRGFPATLFVVADKIGGVADWPGATSQCCLLSSDELRHLLAQGHSIGSHSATHASLTHLMAADLQAELRGSRRRLEQSVGISPAAFAYPYGAFGKRERDAVVEAGYGCACGIRGWSNARDADLFALRRIEMWAGYSMREFEALMTARFKWPRLTRAAKHIVGEIQHAVVGHHSKSTLTNY